MATSEELQAQIDDLMRKIAELDVNSGSGLTRGGFLRDPYQEENERMERYLSEFTVRQGALLTIAGLLSMLPFTSDEYLNHFLIWSFPFLVIAIACYILSSKRINFVARDYPILLQSHEVNHILRVAYYRSAFFHKGTDIAITVFFFSFVSNYYAITLLQDLSVLEQILVTVISIGVGAMRLWYITTSNCRFQSNLNPTSCSPGQDPVPMIPDTLGDIEEIKENDSSKTEEERGISPI